MHYPSTLSLHHTKYYDYPSKSANVPASSKPKSQQRAATFPAAHVGSGRPAEPKYRCPHNGASKSSTSDDKHGYVYLWKSGLILRV